MGRRRNVGALDERPETSIIYAISCGWRSWRAAPDGRRVTSPDSRRESWTTANPDWECNGSSQNHQLAKGMVVMAQREHRDIQNQIELPLRAINDFDLRITAAVEP